MKRRNTNNKVVVAKKNYKCSCCNGTISVGNKYLRINVKGQGIFHFCKFCKDNRIGYILQKIHTPFLEYEEYEDMCIRALANGNDF